MHHRAVTILLLALMTTVVACDGARESRDIPGRWELQTINGEDVPAPVRVVEGETEFEVIIEAASFDFSEDGTCVWTTVRNGSRICNDACSWELVPEGSDPMRVVIGDAPSRGTAGQRRMRLEGQWGNVLVFEPAGAVPADEPADAQQAPCPFLRCGTGGARDTAAASTP